MRCNVVGAGEVEFFLIAESGILEAQALLLCASIRRFAGAYSAAAVTVVSPRKECRPSQATQWELRRLGAEYLELDVHSPCPAYGPSHKVYAAARVERRPGPPVVVQLDSDTLFVGEPDFSLDGVDAAARPVDVKGMCTCGDGDPFDPYWRALCALCGVDYHRLPLLESTVDLRTVRASYNGGLLAARRASGIFQRTAAFFTRLVSAGMKPLAGTGVRIDSGTGVVDAAGSEYWGASQAVFSLAVTAGGSALRILPASHNVPIHMFESIEPAGAAPVHVHYHRLCSAGCRVANPLLDGRLPLPEQTTGWLRARLPLNEQP
ncbi:MAG: hypothetical protein M3O35_02165 [Acidobacteriota bacterium]|nr:hypothetical protein [Acidobacteriota bacterium]